jgi:hypothetical protein
MTTLVDARKCTPGWDRRRRPWMTDDPPAIKTPSGSPGTAAMPNRHRHKAQVQSQAAASNKARRPTGPPSSTSQRIPACFCAAHPHGCTQGRTCLVHPIAGTYSSQRLRSPCRAPVSCMDHGCGLPSIMLFRWLWDAARSPGSPQAARVMHARLHSVPLLRTLPWVVSTANPISRPPCKTLHFSTPGTAREIHRFARLLLFHGACRILAEHRFVDFGVALLSRIAKGTTDSTDVRASVIREWATMCRKTVNVGGSRKSSAFPASQPVHR